MDEKIMNYFDCKLLHPKRGFWDGTYRYDEYAKEHVPNIVLVCATCDNSKESDNLPIT